ncbi:hypothetical protein Anas_12591 [Armadillidium nasatum]|uniref:Uncharacterized protein n=1 Tax=Armadillidium nasatum TaxID=96803 RepID=A0A5N5TAB0_9CRUS|nr:hypothetical protein Anas_12591 [Armadillidium nasatum]
MPKQKLFVFQRHFELKTFLVIMDKKFEEEMKVKLFESEEDNKESNIRLEQLSTLEEIEERNCFGSIDVKNEIEVKEEPFDGKEEEIEVKEDPLDFEKDTTNDEPFDNICGMYQNQVQKNV